jgi:hypothetical protein
VASRRYRAKNSLNSNISQVNARISQISKRPSPRRVATNSISSVQIREATVTAANLDRGSVTSEKLAADAVRTGNIEDGAVTLEKLAPNVISEGAVTLNLTDTTKTTGVLPVSRGGTGGADAAAARTSLGAAATSHTHTSVQITDFNLSVDARLSNYAQLETSVVFSAVNGGDGTFNTALRSSNIPNFLTGTAAVAVFATSVAGRLGVSGSSERFKQDIKTLELDVETILSIEPKSFLYNSDVEEFGIEGSVRAPGFIAEDLDKAGLGIFVHYSQTDGAPLTINYHNYVVALQTVAKYQDQKIKNLESRIEALENSIGQ